MLPRMPSIQQTASALERSPHDINKHTSGDGMSSEDALCPGCGTSAMREEGGLVVAFGQSFFHVDCFRCAKCHEKVTADTNLLLLSDGSPVCANCTYCCMICHQAINDEAIMAGDDSFHAHCFKCKICKNPIDELTYARTSHGIYCMDCHNDRVARNRRHALKKAEMAATAHGGNGVVKSRTTEPKKLDQENERLPPIGQNRAASLRTNGISAALRLEPDNLEPSHGLVLNGKAKTPHYVSDAFFPSDRPLAAGTRNIVTDKQHAISNTSLTRVSRTSMSDSNGQAPLDQDTHAISSIAEAPQNDKRAHDDRTRPLTTLKKNDKATKGKIDNDFFQSSSSINGRLSIPASPINSDNPALRSIPPSPTFPKTRLSASSSLSQLNESGSVPTSSLIPTGNPNIPRALDGAFGSPMSRLPSFRQPEADDETVVLKPDPSQLNGISPHHQTSFDSLRPRQERRSASPIHQIDVPDSVEDGTDIEMEPAPPPPPKSEKDRDDLQPEFTDFELDAPTQFQHYTLDEIALDPISRASPTTYIAPALPPIRFSMHTADFSDLLNTVSELRSHEPQISEHANPGGIPQSMDSSADSQLSSTPPSKQPPGYLDYTAWVVGSVMATSNGDGAPRNAETEVSAEFGDSLSESHAKSSSRVDQTSSVTSATIVSEINRTISNFASDSSRPASPSDFGGAKPALLHLKRLLQDESEAKISVDRKLLEQVVRTWEARQGELVELKARLDGVRRTSKQCIEGLTVAQAEYDRELKARSEAETEITRLRIILSGQTARLTALSSDNRRQEQRQKTVQDVHDNLLGLEKDLARLIVERDMILAEMQELSNATGSNASPTSLVRSLSQGLENLKSQYQKDLVPLKQEGHILVRETSELKGTRDALLEEATALNARNEDLTLLSQEYLRRMEVLPLTNMKEAESARGSHEKSRLLHQQANNHAMISSPMINIPVLFNEEEVRNKGNQRNDGDATTPSKKFKWPGSKGKEQPQAIIANEIFRVRPRPEHNFTQISILRFTRCDHCGDKMWGSQLRCTLCNTSIHVRCVTNIHVPCSQNTITMKDEHGTLALSMFGRDLADQATADCLGPDSLIPVIVDKCIEAVELSALDYEGIYRKNGGAGQSRLITQLFERGDYSAFDLRDSERFPDICSVTSVLKNYFRSLPIPLLTFDLYEDFISATQISDPGFKHHTFHQLVHKLPRAHHQTLRKLMLHLHCIHEHSDKNRMNARNLGVVFGPTLMKSRYPGSEFSDMAGKALSIEWLIEHAPSLFTE